MIENISTNYDYNNTKINTAINSIICTDSLSDDDILLNCSDLENKQLQIQKSKIKILDLFKQSNIISSETNILSGKFKYDGDEELKALQALQKIRRNLNYAKNNINENVINELVSNGFSLNKISFKILHAVMKEMPSDKFSTENINNEIDDIFKYNNIPVEDKISQVLNDNALPNTTSNINSLNNMTERFESVRDFTDSSILSLLKDEKEISLDNLHIYKSFSKSQNKKTNEEIVTLLKSEIEKTMNNNFIELNDENKEISELLVKNEIPLTKENILKVKFLRNINNLSIDDLLKVGVQAIKSDVIPTSIDVFNELLKISAKDKLLNDYKNTVDFLPSITDINIYSILQNQKPLTLLNLKNLKQNDSLINNKFDINVIEAKKQLQQLQQKLTYETIYRLADKNIDINTMEIDKALDATNEAIKENYKINLNLIKANISSENINTMHNLFNALNEFNIISSNVYANIINNEIPFTINKVSARILKEKVLKDYESLSTTISKKYGDDFKKVEKDIPIFLESIGMEPTKANIKAFTILSKNNIDVSKESLLQTKVIDQKIEHLLDNLHPNIAAKIIKDGLDPLEMHIDEVIKYITDFNKEMGNDLPEKISSYIFKMDASNSLKKDRDSMIAMYRLLNTIKKNDNIVIGASIKNGTNLTLGNLLELSKYVSTNKQLNHTDISIDDNFGYLDEVIVPENNIKNILSANDKNKFTYNENNLNTILKNISPFVLEKLDKDYMNTSLEILKEQIENIIENNIFDDIYNTDNLHENLKMINTAINSDPKTFLWMEKNNIPVTFKNIIQSQSILKEKNFLSDQLNEIDHDGNFISESALDTNLTSLKKDINVFSTLRNALHKYINNTSSSVSLEKFLLVENLLSIREKINSNGNEISLPIKLHDRITDLNMYVMNENINSEVDKLDILISLNTTNLKTVKVLVNIDNDKVSLDFKCENQNSVDFLETNKENLSKYISDASFKLSSCIIHED